MEMDYDNEDDAWLESEIQKELDAIGDTADEEEKDEPTIDDVINSIDEDIDKSNDLPDTMSPTMQDYLQRYKGQTSFLEQELLDCDTLLFQIEKKIGAPNDSAPDDYLLNAAKERGEDPVKMRREILKQLDEEDEEELVKGVNESQADSSPDVEDAAFMTETGEVLPSKLADSVISEETLAPGEGVMVVFTETDILEREFHKQMENWHSQQQKKEIDRKLESEKRLEEFRLRIQESEEKRMRTLDNLDEEGKKLTERRKAEEARFEQLAEAQRQRFQHSVVDFEAQMEALSSEFKKEQELHELIKRDAEQRVEEQRHKAAVKIQSNFRRYRVLKQHGATVKNWTAQRKDEIMAERLMKAEVSIRKRKEREKLEEQTNQEEEEEKQQKEIEEKRRKEETEKIQQLEVDEKRKKDKNEKKKREEEKKALEDEERTRNDAEKQRIEEEKRLKDEEEKVKREEEKRKKEEDKKRKEEEKRKKAEELRLKKEEEKRRKEEEKQNKEKEKRLKEEEKKKEEDKRIQEEERKKTDLAREEEMKEAVRLTEEEEERKEAERLAKEAEEKQKEEVKRKEEEKKREFKKERDLKETEKINTIDEDGKKLKETEEKRELKKQLDDEEKKEKLAAMKKKRDEMIEQPSAPVGPCLEDLLQQKRLAWMQTCTPWSKISMEMKSRRTPVSKRPSRRPTSAKNLQILPESEILTAAEVKGLNDVTTVELCDLPGYSVATLGRCENLQHLSMTNCNLVSLDGLSSCSRLAVLECQNNKIEMINLTKLEHLLYVDLTSNNLTSIHGIDGCKNIRHLNLSKNRITRLSSIGHCPQLHTLILSHNQLIRTQNLNEAPTIQVLDLSHNNLQSLDDLEKLGMLRRLDASSNNVLQFPSLTNHVLLEELLLDDNSIGSLGNLATCWLPLLHHLSINQNSVTSLEDMGGCLLLKKLDIGNNQMTDLDCVLKAFPSVPRLEQIWLCGNPVTELDKQFKAKVISKCESLQFIDDEKVPERGKISQDKPSSYEMMCLQQYQVNNGLFENYQKHIRSVPDEDSLITIAVHQDYFDKSSKILTDYRYCHEYGEIKTDSLEILKSLDKNDVGKNHHNTSDTETRKSLRNSRAESVCSNSSRRSMDKTKSNLYSESEANHLDSKAKFNALLGASSSVKTKESSRSTNNQNGDDSHHVGSRSKFEEALIGAGMAQNVSNSVQRSQMQTSETSASYSDSKSKFDALLQSSQKPRFDTTGGNQTSALTSQSLVQNALKKARFENAAIKIQALWRGYYLRKQIQNAYQYARMNGRDEEDDLFGEEVDLSAFDLNEDDLDKDWVPSDVPTIPMNNLAIGYSHAVLKQTNQASDVIPHPPSAPKHAWKDGQGCGKPPLPPSSAMSGQDTQRTWQSKKEEQISEECLSTPRSCRSRKEDDLMINWGFKDSKTAEMMMQRAKKLKYNALRKKKLSQLDPKQRLELMRKLEETNHMSPVQPPKRPAASRKEYFKAKEDDVRHKEHEKQEENKNKADRMYEWLHGDVQSGDDMSSVGSTPQPNHGNTALFRARNHGSDGNLPRLTPELMAGGRVTLMGSPSLELQSVDGSQAESEKIRRNSVGETQRTLSQTQFPSIKINSAPTKKPEKMSWRGPETNKSVGWGGGKKRSGKI